MSPPSSVQWFLLMWWTELTATILMVSSEHILLPLPPLYGWGKNFLHSKVLVSFFSHFFLQFIVLQLLFFSHKQEGGDRLHL